jgi:hypothetical protein
MPKEKKMAKKSVSVFSVVPILVIGLVGFVLAGCGTTPFVVDSSVPVEQSAEIQVADSAFFMTMDGKPISGTYKGKPFTPKTVRVSDPDKTITGLMDALNSDNYIPLDGAVAIGDILVPAGEHTFTIMAYNYGGKVPDIPLKGTFEAGKKYYINAQMSLGESTTEDNSAKLYLHVVTDVHTNASVAKVVTMDGTKPVWKAVVSIEETDKFSFGTPVKPVLVPTGDHSFMFAINAVPQSEYGGTIRHESVHKEVPAKATFEQGKVYSLNTDATGAEDITALDIKESKE